MSLFDDPNFGSNQQLFQSFAQNPISIHSNVPGIQSTPGGFVSSGMAGVSYGGGSGGNPQMSGQAVNAVAGAKQQANKANRARLRAIAKSISKSGKELQGAENYNLALNKEQQQNAQGSLMAKAAGGGVPISAVNSYSNQLNRNANIEDMAARNQTLGMKQGLGSEWRGTLGGVQQNGPDIGSILPYIMQMGAGGGGMGGGSGAGILGKILSGMSGKLPNPIY